MSGCSATAVASSTTDAAADDLLAPIDTVSSVTTGNNAFLSAVVVSIAVVPSVYSIVYLRALSVNATTVPRHAQCPSSCVATVRPK